METRTTSERGREPPAVERLWTQDGSETLVRVDTGWSYRSRHGAVEEARTVFIAGSELLRVAEPLRVLEFGFGAATNFVQTVEALQREGRRSLTYCAVDASPVSARDIEAFGGPMYALAARATLEGKARSAAIELEVRACSFASFDDPRRFDVVYFDPFGPTEEPQSWSVDVFRVAYRHAAPDARLVTYSAAGWIRRNMAAAGFFVATVAGQGTKREFTVAAKRPERLAPWRLRNRPDPAVAL